MNKSSVKKIVHGNVKAEAVVVKSAFSFLGDIDLETAEIIIDGSQDKGVSIAGKVLLFTETKGSSGAALVLQTLQNIGKIPAAIVSVKPPDFNLTESAILLKVPYATGLNEVFFKEMKTGQNVELDTEGGEIIVLE